jgi:hypothetical protein
MSDDQRDALLSRCQLEIELAWNKSRDVSVVYRLVAEHPALADDLYEFFVDVIEAEDEYDRPRLDRAEMDRKVREMLEEAATSVVRPTGRRTFLRLLMDAKDEPLEAIAASLDVTADFLVDLSDNGRVLPMKARRELVRRAQTARAIDEAEAIGSFDVMSRRKAASRDGAYRPSRLTYEGLVKRSGLSAEQKGFWAELA